jgi:hypothetical protein
MTLAYAFGSPAPTTNVLQHTTLGVRSAVYEIRRAARPEVRGDITVYVASLAAVTAFVAVTIVLVSRGRKRREDSSRKP